MFLLTVVIDDIKNAVLERRSYLSAVVSSFIFAALKDFNIIECVQFQNILPRC